MKIPTFAEYEFVQIQDKLDKISITVETLKLWVNNKYVLIYLNSSMGNRIMKEKARTTAGLYNLSTGKIKSIVMPFPTVDEQKEIIRILENVLDKEQQFRYITTQLIEEIDAIKKSILSKAFRGELGTNDPEEESAIELLKGIL